MNGVALLVALALSAAPGVEYSFQTAADNQQEYTIQIPPEFLKLVADGQEIQSDVPPAAGQVQRLCVRIGPPVQHTAAAEKQFRQLLVSAGRYASADPALTATDAQPTILWPARANPEASYNVRTGWQPDVSGNQFYVQVDRTLLRSLANGDEIYVPVDPSAGKPARFIVKTGTATDDLPRIAPPPSRSGQSPLAQTSTTAGSGGRFSSGPEPATPPPSNFPAPATAPRFGGFGQTTSEQAAASRFNPGVGETQPSATTQFNSPPTNSFASRDQAPLLQPPPVSYGDVGATRAPAGYSYPPAQVYPPAQDSRIADARGVASNPAGAGANPDYSQYQRGAYPPPAAVPDYSQYARGPYAATTDVGPIPHYGAPPVNQPPAATRGTAPQQSLPPYNPGFTDNRMAAVPPTVAAPPTTLATNQIGAPPDATVPPAKESWGPFTVVLFALFFSIGGNAYLAWTALEFHGRYRNAIERLRSTARST